MCDETTTADPQLAMDADDQLQHVLAALRVHAVGRLVEEDQSRIVDDGLRQLDPLLHPGREPADQPVALLIDPDLVEHIVGPLPGGFAHGNPLISAMCPTKSAAVTSSGRQSDSGM